MSKDAEKRKPKEKSGKPREITHWTVKDWEHFHKTVGRRGEIKKPPEK